MTWYKNNVPIIQSSRIHSVHSHNKRQDQFNLRIRSLAPMDFGNYTCGVLDNTGSQVDGDNMVVDKLPPPPAFYSRTDRVNETSQLLTWTGEKLWNYFGFKLNQRWLVRGCNCCFELILTLMLLIPFTINLKVAY